MDNIFKAIEDNARPFNGLDANVIADSLVGALGRDGALRYIAENAAPQFERWNRVRNAIMDRHAR